MGAQRPYAPRDGEFKAGELGDQGSCVSRTWLKKPRQPWSGRTKQVFSRTWANWSGRRRACPAAQVKWGTLFPPFGPGRQEVSSSQFGAGSGGPAPDDGEVSSAATPVREPRPQARGRPLRAAPGQCSPCPCAPLTAGEGKPPSLLAAPPARRRRAFRAQKRAAWAQPWAADPCPGPTSPARSCHPGTHF